MGCNKKLTQQEQETIDLYELMRNAEKVVQRVYPEATILQFRQFTSPVEICVVYCTWLYINEKGFFETKQIDWNNCISEQFAQTDVPDGLLLARYRAWDNAAKRINPDYAGIVN